MMLEIGYNHSFEIRKETILLPTNAKISIAFLSDFHFNKFSTTTINSIVAELEKLNPSIILLGGDYVDSEIGLSNLNIFLSKLHSFKNVFAIAGNHDYFFGIDKINQLFAKHTITWLQNNSAQICVDDVSVLISNNVLETCNKVDVTKILLLHKPIVSKHISANFNLVFAGHLHGCQFVFWKNKNGLYPGKLFYKNNFMKFENENCTYFNTKGLGDTLPIRFNCKKNFIFISN
ncbi:MAG: hypothetical protein RL708_126 [Bacteroidota bacterium]